MKRQVFPRWLPLQVAHLYDFPLHLTGKGESVAIISLGGKIDREELANDLIHARIPAPQLEFVDVDPENITKAQDQMFTGETHLDVEVLASICPEARIIVYRGSWHGGFATAINRAVDEGVPVISISWGYPEYSSENFDEIEKALQRARKHNTTVCVASGDAGSSASFAKPGEIGPAKDGGAHVFYPASSPNVIACGGTELILENQHYHEVVWNNIALKKGATGGGVSVLFDKPKWQAELHVPHANCGRHGRIIPDVAGLAASRDWETFMSGHFRPAGGTSAVAPLWAALFVLVNELRTAKGKPPIGYVNEILYSLAQHHNVFREISAGTNRLAADYPGYDACVGFDACTGWGTPRANRLVKHLAEV